MGAGDRGRHRNAYRGKNRFWTFDGSRDIYIPVILSIQTHQISITDEIGIRIASDFMLKTDLFD